MKIDLHLHTKKTKEDNYKREIKPQEFINKMKSSYVGVVGITNHNYFCENQFKEIVDIANNDILVLPGVELTVFVNDKKKIKHINLIFDNNEKSISNLQKFLNDKNISSKNPVDIYDVINFFNDQKVIFYPDKKSSTSERGFSDDDIKKLFIENENFKNVFVLDINVKDFYHFTEKQINALTSSDVKNWDTYLEESMVLLNYYEPILSFGFLYDIFRKNESYKIFIKDNLLRIINNVKIENANTTLNNIPIFEKSINVIFGSKATGKTTLLTSLYEALEVDKNKKILYPNKDSKKYNCESLAKSAKDYDSCNKEFNEIEEKIYNGLKNIIGYKEEFKSNYINQFFLYHKDMKYNHGKFKIISTNKDIVMQPSKQNTSIKTIINHLKKSIEENYLNNAILYEDTKKKVEDLIIEWKKEYCRVNLEFHRYLFIDKTISNLSNILKNNKKVLADIKRFGLYETFIKRLDFNNKIKDLKTLIFNNKESRLGGEIILKEIILKYEYIVPIENSSEKGVWLIKCIKKLIVSKHGREKSTDLKDLLKFVINRKVNDFSNPTNQFNNEKMKSINESLNDKNCNIFKEEFKFCLKNETDINKEPSLGEKSYIFLKNELNNEDADWLFIDEPEEHLNNQFISEFLLKDFENLTNQGKTIIVTTHNSILGINTKPRNYLMRENIKNEDLYRTWSGDLVNKKMKPLFDNKDNKIIYIIDVLLKYFEGNKELYAYRGEIYDLKGVEKNE